MTEEATKDIQGGISASHYPIPSESPADPLNWPKWRRLAVLFNSSFYAFVANFTSASIAAALNAWPMFFPSDAQRPFAELTYLIAVSPSSHGTTIYCTI
jgi:hypothetical protein